MKQNLSIKDKKKINTILKNTIIKTPTENLQIIYKYWENSYNTQHDAYSKEMVNIYGKELESRK